MDTTWILIAHRGGARLFAHEGPGRALRLIEDIAHPEGRLQNQELDADEGGRAYDRFGGQRHTMSTEEEPTEHVARRFAGELAEKLKDGRVHGRCNAIVLAANPRFLGQLREALDKPTADLVTASLDKDLQDVAEQDLARHLAAVLKL